VSTAADALDSAFTRKKTVRRHLCPLDLADDLPSLSFGTLNSAVPSYTVSLIAQIAECNEGGRRKELIRAWPRNLPDGHQSVSKLLIRRHPTGLFFAAARTDRENS
jgi:hypothetical protein